MLINILKKNWAVIVVVLALATMGINFDNKWQWWVIVLAVAIKS